jgi:diguanylate cyclase (GGDEF)-like protein
MVGPRFAIQNSQDARTLRFRIRACHMPATTDLRIVELKLLVNVAEGTWSAGLSTAESAGQAVALGLTRELYADMILTLLEDGYLYTTAGEITTGLAHWARNRDTAERGYTLRKLLASDDYYRMTATYRGLRLIDELREQLRRDRILEKFGILLDGRYIVSDLIHFLERAQGEPVSLLLADVDDFKRFNSEHGYQAGDAVLCHVFRIVRQTIGMRGEVYRRGGEEIVALLPYFGLDASTALAQRICEEVAKTVVAHDGKELCATLSIGVTASPPNDPDGPGLEAHAENGLKRAKRDGKNRVAVA